VPGPDSIYEGVHKLPPAHYLMLEGGRVTTHRYWRLQFEPKLKAGEAELTQRLLELLDESVRLRLVSDVPFGAFLSGGLDSSIVAVLMARHLSTPVKTFSIGFREDAFNEIPDARRIAQHIGADHHEEVMTPDAVGMVNEIAWYLDEPFGDSSSIPTFLVARMAVKHVKMALSGDGGDEAFAGYERYRKFMKLDAATRLSLGLVAPGMRLAGKVAGGHLGTRLGRMADRTSLAFPERYLSGVALSTNEDLRPILSPDIAALDPYARVRAHFQRDDIHTQMDQVLSGDVDSYLVDDILVKVDRMTMANSLEARAPLLDHVLLEFCAQLPFDLKSDFRSGKYLLKKAARALLPPESLNKRKQGFGIPIAQWFRGELKPLMQELIGDRAFRERGVFDVAGVKRMYDLHLAGNHDFGELLWLILTYEMWARTWLDRRAEARVPAVVVA
jgi:asparagine synthase (glutamine-hydrolysing)